VANLTGTQIVRAPGDSGSFTINGQTAYMVANMTPTQVLAEINSPMRINGASGFAGAGATVGGAVAAITVAAPGFNGTPRCRLVRSPQPTR